MVRSILLFATLSMANPNCRLHWTDPEAIQQVTGEALQQSFERMIAGEGSGEFLELMGAQIKSLLHAEGIELSSDDLEELRSEIMAYIGTRIKTATDFVRFRMIFPQAVSELVKPIKKWGDLQTDLQEDERYRPSDRTLREMISEVRRNWEILEKELSEPERIIFERSTGLVTNDGVLSHAKIAELPQVQFSPSKVSQIRRDIQQMLVNSVTTESREFFDVFWILNRLKRDLSPAERARTEAYFSSPIGWENQGEAESLNRKVFLMRYVEQDRSGWVEILDPTARQLKKLNPALEQHQREHRCERRQYRIFSKDNPSRGGARDYFAEIWCLSKTQITRLQIVTLESDSAIIRPDLLPGFYEGKIDLISFAAENVRLKKIDVNSHYFANTRDYSSPEEITQHLRQGKVFSIAESSYPSGSLFPTGVKVKRTIVDENGLTLIMDYWHATNGRSLLIKSASYTFKSKPTLYEITQRIMNDRGILYFGFSGQDGAPSPRLLDFLSHSKTDFRYKGKPVDRSEIRIHLEDLSVRAKFYSMNQSETQVNIEWKQRDGSMIRETWVFDAETRALQSINIGSDLKGD